MKNKIFGEIRSLVAEKKWGEAFNLSRDLPEAFHYVKSEYLRTVSLTETYSLGVTYLEEYPSPHIVDAAERIQNFIDHSTSWLKSRRNYQSLARSVFTVEPLTEEDLQTYKSSEEE